MSDVVVRTNNVAPAIGVVMFDVAIGIGTFDKTSVLPRQNLGFLKIVVSAPRENLTKQMSDNDAKICQKYNFGDKKRFVPKDRRTKNITKKSSALPALLRALIGVSAPAATALEAPQGVLGHGQVGHCYTKTIYTRVGK